MTTFTQVFLSGLRRSLQWRLLLPLYLTGLLFGLVQTWPVWLFGVSASPYLATVASGGLDALVNLLMGNRSALVRAIIGSLVWLGLGLGLILLANLAYNFFCGGILRVWVGLL